MFCPDIVLAIENGGSPPNTVAECIERAIHVEYRLALLKVERARNFEARKNQWNNGNDSQAKRFHQGQSINGFQEERETLKPVESNKSNTEEEPLELSTLQKVQKDSPRRVQSWKSKYLL